MTAPAITLGDLTIAARARLAACEAVANTARKAEAAEIAECRAIKRTPGDGYWQRRFDADERLRCARALAEGLEG